jgi:gluconate 2-dehydrogenase gamma chain
MHEDPKNELSRRALVGTGTLFPLVALRAATPPATSSAFPPPQLRLIEALVDRLIPGDENGPGALECGVADYIGRSFAGHLAGEREAFTEGLAAIDAFARKNHDAFFADLAPQRKDEILAALESNEAAGFKPDSRTFFNRIRQLTLEGMFGDPYYGGNRGFAGWDLIRYPGPRLAVSADEQKLREPVKPLRTSAHGGRHGG